MAAAALDPSLLTKLKKKSFLILARRHNETRVAVSGCRFGDGASHKEPVAETLIGSPAAFRSRPALVALKSHRIITNGAAVVLT